MPGVVLDAGAFIALERRKTTMIALAARFVDGKIPLVTSAGVVAQLWRSGPAQFPVRYLLRHTTVVDLTYAVARVLGRMLEATRSADPVDAHVVFLARERGYGVVTADAADLLRLDPKLRIERI